MKKNKFFRKFIFALLVPLFSLSACSGDSAKLNGNWITESAVRNGNPVQITDSNITFEVSGSTADIYGCSGVNNFSGQIKLKKNTFITGDNIAMTKMMGDSLSQDFEDFFILTLLNSSNYKIENDRLVIYSRENNSEIVFVKK